MMMQCNLMAPRCNWLLEPSVLRMSHRVPQSFASNQKIPKKGKLQMLAVHRVGRGVHDQNLLDLAQPSAPSYHCTVHSATFHIAAPNLTRSSQSQQKNTALAQTD